MVIIRAYKQALVDALEIAEEISQPVNIDSDKEMMRIIKASIGTKMVARWSELMCRLALDAVRTVATDASGRREVDIKRYARIEKVPGGLVEDCRVLDGIMLNKDITHPKMRRRIEFVFPDRTDIDIPVLSYWIVHWNTRKESHRQISKSARKQTGIESYKSKRNKSKHYAIKSLNSNLISLLPRRVSLVLLLLHFTNIDLAQHYFVKANVTALRRVRKTDNNRIARAVGATIVNRVEDIRESDIGVGCGLFNIEKIGDEYFSFLTACHNPKACTILLRGPSKDIINEIERNLQDAMFVTRNIYFHPRLCPGGGATEMAIAVRLAEKAKSIPGVIAWPYKSVADAMEVIPRTLVQNCGGNAVKVLTDLRVCLLP